MRSQRSARSRSPLVAEAVLFLLFAVLLTRLYLVPDPSQAGGVRWWAWLAAGAPFFLGLMVEWRRKKRPLLTREQLLRDVEAASGRSARRPGTEG